jgi:hypothetical protein
MESLGPPMATAFREPAFPPSGGGHLPPVRYGISNEVVAQASLPPACRRTEGSMRNFQHRILCYRP